MSQPILEQAMRRDQAVAPQRARRVGASSSSCACSVWATAALAGEGRWRGPAVRAPAADVLARPGVPPRAGRKTGLKKCITAGTSTRRDESSPTRRPKRINLWPVRFLRSETCSSYRAAVALVNTAAMYTGFWL